MNVYMELLKSLVDLIRYFRAEGYTYREINGFLGLADGTSWSSYRIMKRPRAKQYIAFCNA